MSKWVLPLIVFLAFLLRVIGLSSLPVGFTPDEASFGYDAYSILKTGKDQWGQSFPLVLRSFGDFKLPVYTYLTVPSVAIFGLTEFAVRLPNAIIGTLAVLVTYFLTYELSKNKKLAIFASLLLGISPWHIPMSRGAFEANLTTLFLPLGIFLFIKGLENKKLLILSALVFGINLYTYHTARLLTPLIVGYLVFSNLSRFRKNKLAIISSILFSLFFLSSIFFYAIGGSRLTSSSVLTEVGNWAGNDRYSAIMAGEPNLVASIFNNRFTYGFLLITKNYLSYFSPQFLFTNGPAEGTYGMLPGMGVLYLAEAVLFIGFLLLLVKKPTKETLLILLWILISPLPAAITKGPGYAANRVEFMIPAIQIALAYGGFYLMDFVKQNFKSKKCELFKLGFLAIYLVNVFIFAEKYIYRQRVQEAGSMIYGVGEIMESINESKYENIIVSKSISEPQIYAAFYKQIDPEITQEESKDWLRYESEGFGWVDQLGSYKLGKYTFKSIDKIVDFKKESSLIIGREEEFPPDLIPERIFFYPNGKVAYIAYETQ